MMIGTCHWGVLECGQATEQNQGIVYYGCGIQETNTTARELQATTKHKVSGGKGREQKEYDVIQELDIEMLWQWIQEDCHRVAQTLIAGYTFEGTFSQVWVQAVNSIDRNKEAIEWVKEAKCD